MKIGILSDTHKKVGRAKKAIDMLLDNGAKYLIHAGDIVKVETLEYLEKVKIPYVAVLGNNDYNLIELMDSYNLFREPYYFKIEDISFKLMHQPWFLTPDTDVIIYGHTHQFFVDFKSSLYINPGEACARNKPISEAVILEISDDSFKIDYFYREIKKESWKKREYTYARKG